MAEKKRMQEMSFKSKVGFLILIVVIVAAIILLYKQFETQAILRECEEIEAAILSNPELQNMSSTCECYPGKQYKDLIEDTDNLTGKADLKYIVVCESYGQQRVYPIWESY